jgi:hypothetical protein
MDRLDRAIQTLVEAARRHAVAPASFETTRVRLDEAEQAIKDLFLEVQTQATGRGREVVVE